MTRLAPGMDSPDKDPNHTVENAQSIDPPEVGSAPKSEPGDQAPSPVEEPAPVAEVVEATTEPEIDPLDALRQENERVRGQLLRVAADFDNFRKRTRREIDDAARRSRDDMVRELLPVFDNLERAVSHAEQAVDARSVADGVKMVLKQFLDTLSKVGIKRVESVGTPFDPNFHEAIQQIPSADQPPGTVVAEVLAGYVCDDRLVRAAMVVVAKAPPAPPAEVAAPVEPTDPTDPAASA